MQKIILERKSEKDHEGYADWNITVKSRDNNLSARMYLKKIENMVNSYFYDGYQITIYDPDL